MRRLNCQLFSPKVILPIFEPTVLSDRREEIFTFSVLVECYAHVTKKNNGKIGLKIAQIGNLVAFGDGFFKKCGLYS